MKNTFFFCCRCCFLVVIYLMIAINGYSQSLDIRLLRDINLHRNHSLQGTMVTFTNSDFPVSLSIPAGELILAWKHKDKKALEYGLQTIAGYGINTVLTFGLKYAVNRPRPYVTYPDLQPYKKFNDQSFPSGHTSIAFCSAASISLCYPRWYVIVPSYTWASLVAYSRMYLGVHYPSDVLAGAIVGTGSAWLSLKGNQWLQHHKKHKKASRETDH